MAKKQQGTQPLPNYGDFPRFHRLLEQQRKLREEQDADKKQQNRDKEC